MLALTGKTLDLEEVYKSHSAIGDGYKFPVDGFYTIGGHIITWIVDRRDGSYKVGLLNGNVKNYAPDIPCERKQIDFGELELGANFYHYGNSAEFSDWFEKTIEESVSGDGKFHDDEICMHCGKVLAANARCMGEDYYVSHFCDNTEVYPIP